MSIYLDNAATTRVSSGAAKLCFQAMVEEFGNPSSVHTQGIKADKLIREARQQIANYLKVKPRQIFFTSGGTEANNLALTGAARIRSGRGNHIISTSIEHPSIYNQFQRLENEGFAITKIIPDANGIISPDQVLDAVQPNTILISIMQVNNITGAIQPITEITEQVKKINPEILIHSDAIQALGKTKSFPEELNLDLASYSGHKVHGPKGIGFLYLRRSSYVSPLLLGGGQEDGLRNGTENVPGIVGLGQAVIELPNLSDPTPEVKTKALKNYLLEKLQNDFPEIKINTPCKSAPHIINISRPGLPGEVIVNALNQRDIYISSGSACSSSRGKADRVLLEMGMSKARAEGSIRISLSKDNTKAELDEFLTVLQEELDFLS